MKQNAIFKITKPQRVQVVEFLCSKLKDLSSTPQYNKQIRKKEEVLKKGKHSPAPECCYYSIYHHIQLIFMI
jgi:hypothetical protein